MVIRNSRPCLRCCAWFCHHGQSRQGVATEDMDRLTSLELFGWTTAHTNSRWAVLKQVNGEMKVIGTTSLASSSD